jgi:hypothetical protein
MGSRSTIEVQRPEDWKAVPLVSTLELTCTREHVDRRLGGPEWVFDDSEGLGPRRFIGLRRGGVSRYVLGISDFDDIKGVFVEADMAIDQWTVRWEILHLLGLTSADIAAERFGSRREPVLEEAAGEWQLWRQDDHGNVVAVRQFVTRDEADSARDLLDRQGHPQAYWVERRAD